MMRDNPPAAASDVRLFVKQTGRISFTPNTKDGNLCHIFRIK